jgi:hypothetical protein
VVIVALIFRYGYSSHGSNRETFDVIHNDHGYVPFVVITILFSFMTFDRVCNKSITLCNTSGVEAVFPFGTPVLNPIFSLVLVGFVFSGYSSHGSDRETFDVMYSAVIQVMVATVKLSM